MWSRMELNQGGKMPDRRDPRQEQLAQIEAAINRNEESLLKLKELLTAIKTGITRNTAIGEQVINRKGPPKQRKTNMARVEKPLEVA
jgi:hypothetical protein